MNPFDEPIGDRARDLYGTYAPRFSARKVGIKSHTHYGTAAGMGWVALPWATGPFPPRFFSVSMYEILFTKGLVPWTGSPQFQVRIDGVKVYPEGDWAACNVPFWQGFWSLSMTVRTGEDCVIYMRSSNAADTAGQTLMADVKAVRWMEGLGE